MAVPSTILGRLRRLILTAILISLCFGCDRQDEPFWPTDPVPPGPPLTLEETFEKIRSLHERRSYLPLRAYIHPNGRESVIDLLIAIDELQAANQAALRAIEESCPEAPLKRYDLAGRLVSNLEMFSRDVKFVDASSQDARATVRIRVGDANVLRSVSFERRGDHWLYVPGPRVDELVTLVRELTRQFHRLATLVSTGPRTPRQIDQEYYLFVARRFRKLTGAPDAS